MCHLLKYIIIIITQSGGVLDFTLVSQMIGWEMICCDGGGGVFQKSIDNESFHKVTYNDLGY